MCTRSTTRCCSTSWLMRTGPPDVLLLVEDSAGHAVSRAAEMRFQSQFLCASRRQCSHCACTGAGRLVGLFVGHRA
jgi:hypothetical protein